MPDSSLISIAKRMRNARRSAHLTQVEVAKKAGINANYYAQVERAEKNPTATVIVKISRAIGVKASDILGD